MTYNIGIAASQKISKPDISSKTVGFPSSAIEKNYDFKDSLKVAVRSRSQIEIKPDDGTALRKELVNRAESKLNGLKKVEMKDKENVKPDEEIKEETIDKKEEPIDDLLTRLEELINLQQIGDIPSDKQTALLESIKETLKELVAVETESIVGLEAENLQEKVSALTEILEGLEQGLKTNGSLTDKEASENLIKEFKAIVAETSAKVKTESKKPADNNAAEQLKEQVDSNNNEQAIDNLAAAGESDKGLKVLESDENKNMTAESGMINDAVEKQNYSIKAEAVSTEVKQVNKETQPAAEENEDDVKTALDAKVKEVTVEGKESKGQDTEAGTNKDADKEVHKPVDTTQNKPVNEEMTAIKLEQTVIENKIETIQNQVAVPKAQTVNKSEIINQIVKKAELVLNDAQSEMRMQLEPENLGKLTLKLAVEKGLITAKFVAESYEVKQIIESNFNELKDMLQEKGLEIQNFSVSVGQDNSENNNSNAFHQWKETFKLNARNINRGNYDGYLDVEGTVARIVNPYSVHNGQFDHKA